MKLKHLAGGAYLSPWRRRGETCVARRMLLASLLAPLLVAACTGSHRQVARSACELLTNGELEKVTDANVVKSGPTQLMVNDGSASNDSGLTACSFDTNSPFGAVLVTLQHPG